MISAGLVDTHCHLDFPQFSPDRDAVIARARDAGVGTIINIGSSIEGSRASVALAAANPGIYASVGIHPHEADRVTPAALEELKALSARDKVVAIGEVGLDYFKNYSQPANQRPLFESTVRLAKERGLPLVIHSRDAEDDILSILRGFLPLKAVVHCFSGGKQFLEACLACGFFVSFTCNVTYRKAEALREMVRLTPLERLMLETDAPFLSPEGARGKRNEPAQVKLLAESLAALIGTTPAEIADRTTANAKKFFRIP